MDHRADDGLTIAQMADRTGVTTHTLRCYGRAGLIHPVARTVSDRRRYQPADIVWVEFLLRLRATGMPVARMRGVADLCAQGAGTVPERLALLEEHQHALRAQIDQLHAHERALTDKIAAYRDQLGPRRADPTAPRPGGPHHD